MNYIKSFKYLFLFLLITLVVMTITTPILIFITNSNIPNPILLSSLTAIITSLIFIPILIIKYSKEIDKKLIFKPNYLIFFLVGIILSILINLIYLIIYRVLNIEIIVINDYLILNIISTGILAPILEEYLFRGIIFNNLKKITTIKKAIIISVATFILLHIGIFNMITALIIAVITLYLYTKEKNILVVIIFHIGFNLSSFIYRYFLLNIGITYLILLIIISLLTLLIWFYNYKKRTT